MKISDHPASRTRVALSWDPLLKIPAGADAVSEFEAYFTANPDDLVPLTVDDFEDHLSALRRELDNQIKARANAAAMLERKARNRGDLVQPVAESTIWDLFNEPHPIRFNTVDEVLAGYGIPDMSPADRAEVDGFLGLLHRRHAGRGSPHADYQPPTHRRLAAAPASYDPPDTQGLF